MKDFVQGAEQQLDQSVERVRGLAEMVETIGDCAQIKCDPATISVQLAALATYLRRECADIDDQAARLARLARDRQS